MRVAPVVVVFRGGRVRRVVGWPVSDGASVRVKAVPVVGAVSHYCPPVVVVVVVVQTILPHLLRRF